MSELTFWKCIKERIKQIKPAPAFCEGTLCVLEILLQVQSWESHAMARKSKQYELLNILFVS